MKIEYALYSLHPVGGSLRPARKGALLKVTFPDLGTGYADSHPWPELGNFPLEVHLEMLAQGKETPLTMRSLAFSYIDAKARAAKRHLFHGLPVPDSHFLITDIQARSDIDFSMGHLVKIKAGIDLDKELAFLHGWKQQYAERGCKVFLDFNCRLTQEQFLKFLSQLGSLREFVQFYEDPFPYDPERWQDIRKSQGISLAADLDSSTALAYPDSCDILVVKPALQSIHPFLSLNRRGRQLIITSCLDHPIGQLGAAYVAAHVAKEHRDALLSCGLLSHYSYQTSAYSERLKRQYSRLVPDISGYGWGYDDLLQECAWRPLV